MQKTHDSVSIEDIFTPEYWNIPELDKTNKGIIQQHIDSKTKPPGSLGQLEKAAMQLAEIQGHTTGDYKKIQIEKPTVLIFAADHGIATHAVSIAPREVTRQMVLNFIDGGAAINCFCSSADIDMHVIDAGILLPLQKQHPMLSNRRISAGTEDFSIKPAMTQDKLQKAIQNGAGIAREHISLGSNVLGFGEMGIGNTCTASALLSLLTGIPPEQTTGLGTGINASQLTTKISLIELTIQRIESSYASKTLTPQNALFEAGGFEIAQIVGAMLATASAGRAILVDGFIVSIAAFIATKIAPKSRQFMLFAHSSAEYAHSFLLEKMQALPLLNLDLRLGEGTGAALAVPLLRASASFYNNMATFESAQVNV